MGDVEGEFFSEVDIIIECLEDGYVDDAIKKWDRTFEELASKVSPTARLYAMATYAQVLKSMDTIERARQVDGEVEDWLLEDKNKEDCAIDDEAREALLRNIAERWGLEIDEDGLTHQSDVETSPSPGPQHQSESSEYPLWSDEPLDQVEAPVAPMRPISPPRRPQSFAFPEPETGGARGG